MRIAVCIKQVPVVSAMQFDPQTRTLKREGVPNEVSSFDLRALIKAVELKGVHGGDVVAVTMGPPQAREALEECLALGADRALHLCDPAFAGADTLATARTLALALRREDPDLILCGRNSVDAETAQVGPELAELLDVPQITGVRSLSVDWEARRVTAERETDEGFETVSSPMPAVLTAAEDLAPERFASKAAREAAKLKPCHQVRALDLSPDLSQFGSAGSPTTVASLQHVEGNRSQRTIDAASIEAAAAELARILVSEHGLFGTWRVREQPALATLAPSPRRAGPRDVWVVAEELHGTIRPVVFELLGKATVLAGAIGGQVHALLLGHDVRHHVAALCAHGAERVLLGDDPRFAQYHTEVYAAVLAGAIQSYAPGAVLIPSTTAGRDLAPRVAARLGLGLTGDCIDVGVDAEGRLLHYKPAFGGSIVAPILSRTFPEMATVRPGMLPAAVPDTSRPIITEDLLLPELTEPRTRVVARDVTAASAADLDAADTVIGVGMGIGDKARLDAIQPLAQILGAALATTRDVTDAGWLPKQYQVGLTGRAIAPRLYLAIGIRGAFEHMIGVRRADVIVAINKNAKAPVFRAADYGIVGDYAAVVPALCAQLMRLRPPKC